MPAGPGIPGVLHPSSFRVKDDMFCLFFLFFFFFIVLGIKPQVPYLPGKCTTFQLSSEPLKLTVTLYIIYPDTIIMILHELLSQALPRSSAEGPPSLSA